MVCRNTRLFCGISYESRAVCAKEPCSHLLQIATLLLQWPSSKKLFSIMYTQDQTSMAALRLRKFACSLSSTDLSANSSNWCIPQNIFQAECALPRSQFTNVPKCPKAFFRSADFYGLISTSMHYVSVQILLDPKLLSIYPWFFVVHNFKAYFFFSLHVKVVTLALCMSPIWACILEGRFFPL